MQKLCHIYHIISHLFVYLSVLVYLYAEHIIICMHTQYRELPALASLLCDSSPCLVTFPSPSTVQSSQALGTAWGKQHVWLPGTLKQQQPTPYTHSIYRKHYLAHTALDYTFCSLDTMDVFIGREAKKRKSWYVMVSISSGVSVRVYACVSVCDSVCEMSLYLLTMSGCCEQSRVCSALDSIDTDLDWFWAFHLIFFSTVPVFPPSLLWQTWAC